MSPFVKGIVFIVLAVVVYALWPRTPALNKPAPEKIAAQETKAWRALADGQGMAALYRYYLIYDLQYGFSPVRALSLAQQRTGAVGKILKAADEADMENNTRPLTEFYVIVKRDTGAEFDAATLARMDAAVWSSVASKAWGEGLAKQNAALFADLHGLTELQTAATGKLRAQAFEKAFSGSPSAGDWSSVRSLLQQSYEALKSAAPDENP